MTRPVLLWDGDCSFCRAWIARWRVATGDAVEYATSQQHGVDFPLIAPSQFKQSVVLVEPSGHVSYAAEAVVRALAYGGGAARVWDWAYAHVPGFASVSEGAYALVAGHRDVFARVTRLLWGAHVVPPGMRLTSWVFLRLLGLVYVVAFASLGVQVTGLVGREGLLPIAPLLAGGWAQLGWRAVWLLPTLSWLNASDGWLVAQCVLGVLAGLALAVGAVPAVAAVAGWALYLSLANAGQEFLWFQWDSLLLEAGVLAIVLAPRVAWSSPRRDPAPSRFAIGMLRWLCFRLMFGSALVKWTSGDPEWRNLTALTHHYETQPLPPWTAWYAHHLPASFQRFSAGATLAIEGLLPLLVFAPRRARMFAAAGFAFLQVLIVVTGNYGFFNLLALALCLLLLDDAAWPAAVRRWARVVEHAPVADERRARTGALARAVLAALLVLSLVPLAAVRRPAAWLEPLYVVYRELSPLHLVNSYGLFAVMTTTRPEIVVEGSADGVTWKAYAFRWKAGDPRRRPAFVAPHMPRLDWQMWFAALDPQHVPPWFAGLCGRLLEGSRPVLRLLATNPFPGAPPHYVRARLEAYRFTTAAERRATGAWWVRTPAGDYVPPVVLDGGTVRLAAPRE